MGNLFWLLAIIPCLGLGYFIRRSHSALANPERRVEKLREEFRKMAAAIDRLPIKTLEKEREKVINEFPRSKAFMVPLHQQSNVVKSMDDTWLQRARKLEGSLMS